MGLTNAFIEIHVMIRKIRFLKATDLALSIFAFKGCLLNYPTNVLQYLYVILQSFVASSPQSFSLELFLWQPLNFLKTPVN